MRYGVYGARPLGVASFETGVPEPCRRRLVRQGTSPAASRPLCAPRWQSVEAMELRTAGSGFEVHHFFTFFTAILVRFKPTFKHMHVVLS